MAIGHRPPIFYFLHSQTYVIGDRPVLSLDRSPGHIPLLYLDVDVDAVVSCFFSAVGMD
jgi:hypothetical protein